MNNQFSLRRAAALTAVTLSIQCALPPKSYANPLAIPAVAACTASVYCITGVVAISGITYYWVQWHDRQRVYYPITPNPDRKTIEYSDELVWATTEAEARQKCEALAQRMTQRDKTRYTLKRVEQYNRAKFRCVFEVEQ